MYIYIYIYVYTHTEQRQRAATQRRKTRDREQRCRETERHGLSMSLPVAGITGITQRAPAASLTTTPRGYQYTHNR